MWAAASASARAAAPRAGDEPPWDVLAPHGPSQDVVIDTDEGTWMQVDVSPDGQTLVFDLLGDLYLLPIGGGEAQPFRTGPAWEWQPRFSPDGSRIAFISDRGGGDNVWVCDRDGGNLRPVTKEEFRLVHCPEWMPDGNWILVRKHFTHTRSLGAGEIWMFHEDGEGAGVELTEKSSNTADVNEPAISRDGRWLYFSRAGDFDYNKNVYAGIYSVFRIDRSDGKSELVASGHGGACRPRPSPDLKSLAFIRRVGLKTALIVRELASGRERVLFDGLDFDTQETWSIEGTFPGYCWLPDSNALVITAGGKIVKVDATSGAATPIPFHVKSTQRVDDALRFPHRLEDGEFAAKMVRWPQVTRDRKSVFFQALGKIWRQELGPEPGHELVNVAKGEAVALAHGAGDAFAPALAPDEKWLAFVTWQNGVGGHVWRIDVGGGAPVRLTSAPGDYANPAISPDARRVAFLAGRGGALRGDALSAEPDFEIRWVLADGSEKGEQHDVRETANRGPNRRMPRLFFAPDGDHLLYCESDGERSAFVRTTLDGRERMVLFTNEDAEEIAPSPDGRFVTFKEQHQIYVAPLPSALGRPLVIGRSGAPVPVKQLTNIGGSWPTFSADGKRVDWLLGPDLASQEFAPLFVAKAPAAAEAPKPGAEPKKDEAKRDESANAPEKPAEKKDERKKSDFDERGVRPEATVTRLSAKARSDPPEGSCAFVGARLITMDGDQVIEDGALLVERNRITKVGRRSEVAIPAGAKVVDVAGRTIMPGIVDVHSHMHYDALDVQTDQPWEYLANLAYGVTAAHDPSASTELVFAQSELVRAGAMLGPHIFSTGYILYGAKNPNKAEIESLDDARHHLKRLKAVGAFSVKSYNQPRRNQRQWIIQAARDEQMLVVPEGGSLLAMNETMCLDGHTGIEHNLPCAPLHKDVVELFARSHSGITPTLIVDYGGINGEYWWYQHERIFEKQPLLSLTPPGWLEERARRRNAFAFDDDFEHFKMSRACRDILRAGGHIELGAHGQLQGLGAHWELWMLGQGGMTPLEAIRCATLYGAWYLGLDQDLGSLAPGKIADFVVMKKNPLEQLENSDSIELTVANGRVYRAATMEQLLPEPKPRPTLQWETIR
jgi:imidazolonepropionase-like amidohydrolase/Tol biopolymer transport system component